MRSSFQEGAELFQLADTRCEPLATLGDNTATRAWAKFLVCQGWLTFHLSQPAAAHALLAQSLALLDQDTASEDRVFTPIYLVSVTYLNGNYAEGERLAQAALTTSKQIGGQYGTVLLASPHV